jgi:hypothetical protein
MKDLLKPFSIATAMGIVAVLAVWGVAILFGTDFTVSNLGVPIPVSGFVVFSLIGALGALIASVLILKTKSPRRNGQVIGWLVLIGSIVTPLSGTSDLAAIFWIQATHFAIGVPLLMAMNKHLPETN